MTVAIEWAGETLRSDQDLATILGKSQAAVKQMRLKNKWPHVKLNRNTVRYTDAMIAQIISSMTVSPAAEPSDDRAAPVVAIKGQTSRSARRTAAKATVP